MADSENNMTLAETQPVSENERVQMTTNLAKGLNPEQYAAAFNYSIRNQVPLNFALAMDNRDMRDPVDVGGMLPETKRYFSQLSNAVISKGDESVMNMLFAASHRYKNNGMRIAPNEDRYKNNGMRIAPNGELYDAKFDEWLLPKQKEAVKRRVEEMMVLAALRNKFSDFEKFDEARMEYEVGKMGEKLGIDTSRFFIKDMMPRGFSGEKFWNNLTDIFGYRSLTGKKADYKTLAETFNNLDKVTNPHKISDLLKYMDSQQDALRGETMFAEGAEGLATSLRFMAELYIAIKTLGTATPAAGTSWAARLASWAASAAEAVGVTLPFRALSAVDKAADALEAPEFVIGKDKNIELKATDAEMSDLAVAAANNLINDSIEVFSEQLGNLPFALGARSFVKPLLSNLVPDGTFKTAVAQAMQKVSASGGAAAMREFRRRVSLNGPFTERGEELAGDAMRALSTELAQTLGIKLGDLGQEGITFSTRSEILMWGNILTLQGLGNVHTLGGVPDVFRAVAKAPGFTEAYRKVQEAADATNTKNSSPLLIEMTLRQQLGQKDKVYISVDDADVLFQSAPETAGKIGIDETVISGARDLGVRIPVSLAKLHANVTPQEAETLLPNLMFDPKHALRLADAEKLDMSDEAQKAAEARWQAVQETRKAYDEAISQLTKLGRPETEIRTAARLLSMAEYFAAHSNARLTAADWIRNVAFKRMKETDWLAEYKAKRGLFQNDATFDPENGNFYHQSNAADKHRGATYFENPENYNRRYFNDTWQAVITLFDGAADASTLVHEIGHYAFGMMGRLVDSGMADTRMVEDYNAIMAWASKDTKDPGQIKENLAKGFEAYVMGGKAPTAELTGAFAKLRQLMRAIYKSVKALGVTLTDEVRTVFDGMLASDAALEQDSLLREAAAELNTGLLGLSQSETEVFRELMEKAGNQALQELAAEKARQLTGLKKAWRTMAEDEMAQDRTYKAWAAAVKAGGIDYLDVKAATNSHIADALRKKGLTTKSGRLLKNGVRSGVEFGTHPADIAAKVGYDSVEEMLIDLYYIKSPADFTKQFMAAAEAEFHKSFEVTESAHSVQASVDMLDRFSDILAVKGGIEGYRIRKQEFRRRAQARLAQMTVSRIVNDRSLIGDCRGNIKAMTKAVNESDFATALEAAQKLRENMEVMRQKADAKKAVERTVRTLSKARHAKKGSIYGDHQEALIDISRRFGFAQSERKLNHTAASVIAEYNAEARKNDDVEVEVDNYFLNESHSFKTMQFNNFEQLSNLVDFIYGEGKALVSAQEATLQEKVKTDIAGARADMAHVRNRYNREAPAILRTWRSMAQWGTKLRNIIGMATDWNKESTLQKLYDEMNYAQSMQMQLMTGVSREVSDALKALHKSLKKIDLLPISDIRFPEAVGYRWNTERLVAICLNMGNATNRARLISGYGWGENGEAYLDRIASLLTAADWQNIQKIWNAIGKGELYEAVRRTFKNEKHFDLKEEEAAPFTVVTADGQQIEMAGGYYPLVYERFGSSGTDDSPAPAAHRTASFTYERAAVVSDPVKLSLSIVHTHVFDAAHYATHRETMRHVLRVIGNRDFASDFSMKFGYERYDALKKLVNNVANPEAVIKGEVGILERNLRAITTASALWANPSTVLMQLTSIPVGLDELGGFYRSAVHEMLTDYSYVKNFAFSRSALMRERVNEMDLDIREAAGKFGQSAFDKISKGTNTFGYGFMRLLDGWVVLPVWYAAYNKARLEGADETHAVAHADEFVARTQGSTRAIDMSPAQLNVFGRLFTMFFSATSAAATMATRTISKISKGQGSPAMVACNLVLPVALASLVRFAMSPGGEDDPDRAERAFWRELMASPFQGIPFARNLADAVADTIAGELTGSSSAQHGYKAIFDVTVLRGANDIAGSLLDALPDSMEGNSERALYRVADAAGTFFQVPAVRTYERAKKILEGFGADGLPDINDTVPKKRKRR